jgi:molybdopterin molybdotransferase
MVSVARALEVVLENARPLGDESVPLATALGRVLAQDVLSDVEMPPFDRAAMDGYALVAADLEATPVALDVVGEVRAGRWPGVGVSRGRAVRIMTGAPVPEGADAVVPVEQTRELDGGARVEVHSSVRAGAHIAPRASEVRQGDHVLTAGIVIDPAAVAVLAATGMAAVRVGRQPVVAVLATGDELVSVDSRPAGAQIRNSNGPALAAQARWAGAQVRSLGTAPDDIGRLEDAFVVGVQADVFVVSGGVSAGSYDLVEDVLARFGVEVLFDAIALKPGKPLVFGRRGTTLVFGLPGNPVSSQVTFDLFVRPALLKLQGARVTARPALEARLTAPVRNRSGREYHLPVAVRFADGGWLAEPLPTRGSADLVVHARANGLAVLAAERREAAAGEAVTVSLLGNFLERDGRT